MDEAWAPPAWAHANPSTSFTGHVAPSQGSFGRGYGQQPYPVVGSGLTPLWQQHPDQQSWAPSPAYGINPYANPPVFQRPW